MTPIELKAEIDRLEDVVENKEREFHDKWFKDSGDKPFDEYVAEKKKAVPEIAELNRLGCEYRMVQEPVFSELSDYGDVMLLKDFIASCEFGAFIDYDGHGRYVRDGKESDIVIYPSDVKAGRVRKDFDTIIWFNK